jgi:hypothetical protein
VHRSLGIWSSVQRTAREEATRIVRAEFYRSDRVSNESSRENPGQKVGPDRNMIEVEALKNVENESGHVSQPQTTSTSASPQRSWWSGLSPWASGSSSAGSIQDGTTKR